VKKDENLLKKRLQAIKESVEYASLRSQRVVKEKKAVMK